ncbi:AAA family ATPase [Nocardioides humi]|uniref:MoxR family ATPase n=1 Tax=Nocardioides humi TaxID=449461 RepID=A0ABN2ALS3_9ACTN|nr:MoxR family ATPase [Nocardioides humi]
MISGPDDLRQRLDAEDHLVDDGLATALHLALDLGLPLLLEGEPGVGKTGAVLALARAQGAELLRLQCYEGLGPEQALYEWNYQRQLLAIRLAESRGERLTDAGLFTEEYLEERPLLAAMRSSGDPPPVLLIDEVDRADDEFEALLLEFLGERSISIPELGTVRAAGPFVVVLTSNRSRDLHDALRRRCLYHWIDYPDPEQVARIVRRKVPGASTALADLVAANVAGFRGLDLDKQPGLAEAIDWTRVLVSLGLTDSLVDATVEPARLESTLGAVAKTVDDRDTLRRVVLDGRLG